MEGNAEWTFTVLAATWIWNRRSVAVGIFLKKSILLELVKSTRKVMLRAMQIRQNIRNRLETGHPPDIMAANPLGLSFLKTAFF